MYKEFPSERYFGIIEVQNPVLVLRDPDLVKAIMVKDFNCFSVRTYIGANPSEYILKHVINMNGEEWKEMRGLLTPAFSSAKMKTTFMLMNSCSNRMVDFILGAIQDNESVEITDVFARFTMDVIASCAFGLETDSITDQNCTFFHTVGALLKTTKGRFYRRFIINFFPSFAKIFPIKLIPPEVTSMLTEVVRQSVEHREKYKMQRNDFLDVLIQTRINSHKYSEEKLQSRSKNTVEGLTIEQITAQAFVFFIAGYTTDTSVLSFCLFELSQNKDIQEKLCREVDASVNKHQGQITYQALQEMTYMDQVVNETLRMYGSGQILIRTCTKSYRIPESKVVLEPGTRVVIPTYSFHHDPKYFPEPHIFNPDRFSVQNTKNIRPFVFLPFGEGPRNCIGRSFGLLQIKIGLATILYNFSVHPSPKQRVPIEIDKRCIVVTPANPIHLKFSIRRKNRL
ncbi:probable cytochrome P450 6a13 [Macrosteles quadrilineatus]|uniref:probable cytochrome P450 6a13 n=1 Tax=Macrosteles quadrilineatus TaxID=74068 RepID=UPI0023E12A8D|nr:probable cytochrome P450 6a13 [Macrosteles quadrilineatus]